MPEQNLSDKLVQTFEHLGQLTIERFRQVSDVYGLPEPQFGSVDRSMRRDVDMLGNVCVGQVDAETGDMSGIIRKFSTSGDFLSELYMVGQSVIGLSRHIDGAGCVAYLITDTNSAPIQSKFYDS